MRAPIEPEEEMTDLLVQTARERALEGWDEPVIHDGQRCYERDPEGALILDEAGNPIPLIEHHKSDLLLMFLWNTSPKGTRFLKNGRKEEPPPDHSVEIRRLLRPSGRPSTQSPGPETF